MGYFNEIYLHYFLFNCTSKKPCLIFLDNLTERLSLFFCLAISGLLLSVPAYLSVSSPFFPIFGYLTNSYRRVKITFYITSLLVEYDFVSIIMQLGLPFQIIIKMEPVIITASLKPFQCKTEQGSQAQGSSGLRKQELRDDLAPSCCMQLCDDKQWVKSPLGPKYGFNLILFYTNSVANKRTAHLHIRNCRRLACVLLTLLKLTHSYPEEPRN